MTHPWGRFTARGSAELELEIASLVKSVGVEVERTVGPHEYQALTLLGGYGRGEGGVELREGVEHPHNNLDFLLITHGLSTAQESRRSDQIDRTMAPLRERHELGIDFGLISDSTLWRAPSLVMWYDMRFGHKTILGDAEFVLALDHFRLERIPAWNVRDLLINRGTLLLINDMLLEADAIDDETRRLIVKHSFKAIIGYGDALLFFLGDYHWSYAEKRRRMQARADVPAEFRRMYDEAVEFRFSPYYAPYAERDLAAWMDTLRHALAPIHLRCESIRLGHPQLTWHDYWEAGQRHALIEDIGSPRAWAKKLVHCVQTREPLAASSMAARLGCRTLGPSGLLSIVFPLVTYALHEVPQCEAAARTLGADSPSRPDLRRAYLKRWGLAGDPNFKHVLDRVNVSLEGQEVSV